MKRYAFFVGLISKKKRIAEELKTAKALGIQFGDNDKTLLKCPENVKEVVIPSCVTTIGKEAFKWCGNLQSVTIPDSVTSIVDGAFRGVESVKVADGNPNFYVDDSGVLIDRKNKKLLYCSPSISGNYTIPDCVTYIGESAFDGCYNLQSVTIPNSVTTIGESAFGGVPSVKVADGNPNFYVDDSGVLIDRKNKKLLHCQPSISGNYTIPDSVTTIGDWAFSGCENLQSVTIPDSVTYIGYGTFLGCKNLQSVNIPRNCKVGNYTFPYWCKVTCR